MATFTETNAPYFRQAEAEIHGVSVIVTQAKGQAAGVTFGHPLSGRTPQEIRDIAQVMFQASDLCTNWNREKGIETA